MRGILFCALALLLAPLADAQTSKPTTPKQTSAEQYIRESEAQWAESSVTGDTKAMERFLADDFVGIDPKGNYYDKAEAISETHDSPKYFVSCHLDEIKIRFFGETAVAQGSESWELRDGKRGRWVWTDTWIRRNGRWQIVAAEDMYAKPLTEENPAKQ
jgi:ketosteroid isomerase-like protein